MASAYGGALVSQFGAVGAAIGWALIVFNISFTVTDILYNQDGTLAQRFDLVKAYLMIQAAEIVAGVLSAHSAAAFVATVIMNALYLELLGSLLPKLIRNGAK